MPLGLPAQSAIACNFSHVRFEKTNTLSQPGAGDVLSTQEWTTQLLEPRKTPSFQTASPRNRTRGLANERRFRAPDLTWIRQKPTSVKTTDVNQSTSQEWPFFRMARSSCFLVRPAWPTLGRLSTGTGLHAGTITSMASKECRNFIWKHSGSPGQATPAPRVSGKYRSAPV